jgi:hypothetical protein
VNKNTFYYTQIRIAKTFFQFLSEIESVIIFSVLPAAEGHGLWPWMNAPAFRRDVAPLGRQVWCHGLSPWGSTEMM